MADQFDEFAKEVQEFTNGGTAVADQDDPEAQAREVLGVIENNPAPGQAGHIPAHYGQIHLPSNYGKVPPPRPADQDDLSSLAPRGSELLDEQNAAAVKKRVEFLKKQLIHGKERDLPAIKDELDYWSQPDPHGFNAFAMEVRDFAISGELRELQKQEERDASDPERIRKAQRDYAANADPETRKAARDILLNMGDRRHVLQKLRGLTPEQLVEVMRVAPGIGQKIGQEQKVQRGYGGKAWDALQAGTSHMVAQPVAELLGLGGTEKEIETIRYLDSIRQGNFHPYMPDDPWYVSGSLKAIEMLPWMVSIIASAGRTGELATAAGAGPKMTQAARIAGMTAAGFPMEYARELDSLKGAGVTKYRRTAAALTAALVAAIEGIVINPLAGPETLELRRGAIRAARQHIFNGMKRAPVELSEEYLQGLTSGAARAAATHWDEGAPDQKYGQALTEAWEQAKEAAIPLAFLMGVPMAAGAAKSGYQAHQISKQYSIPQLRLAELQEVLRDKGYVSFEDGRDHDIPGETRRERLRNLNEEIRSLQSELEPPETEIEHASTAQDPEAELQQPEVIEDTQGPSPQAAAPEVAPQESPTEDDAEAQAQAELDHLDAQESAVSNLPPVADGHVRMWRGSSEQAGFTPDLEAAKRLAQHFGGELEYVDVTADQAQEFHSGGTAYALPERIASQAQRAAAQESQPGILPDVSEEDLAADFMAEPEASETDQQELVQQAVPAALKLQSGGLSLRPKTPEGKRFVLDKLSEATGITDDAILESVMDIASREGRARDRAPETPPATPVAPKPTEAAELKPTEVSQDVSPSKPDSPWAKKTRDLLSSVPAFQGSEIELDEATSTARITRSDGRSTTIHMNADAKLDALAKKRGVKKAKGAYVYKTGKKGEFQEGDIYLRSDSGHDTLNHEVIHWLEDSGVITPAEVEQNGGREGIAKAYGEWAAAKQRKPNSLFQRMYDFLETLFSSQRRLFDDIGKRGTQAGTKPVRTETEETPQESATEASTEAGPARQDYSKLSSKALGQLLKDRKIPGRSRANTRGARIQMLEAADRMEKVVAPREETKPEAAPKDVAEIAAERAEQSRKAAADHDAELKRQQEERDAKRQEEDQEGLKLARPVVKALGSVQPASHGKRDENGLATNRSSLVFQEAIDGKFTSAQLAEARRRLLSAGAPAAVIAAVESATPKETAPKRRLTPQEKVEKRQQAREIELAAQRANASLDRGDTVSAYGFEAEVMIPDLGNMSFEPNVARVKFTTDSVPNGKRKGDMMDIPQADLRPLAHEETSAGKAEAEANRKREEKAAADKKVHDELVQQVVPAARQARKAGLSLNPKTKKAKRELLDQLSIATGIKNDAILQEAVDIVAKEAVAPASEAPKKTLKQRAKDGGQVKRRAGPGGTVPASPLPRGGKAPSRGEVVSAMSTAFGVPIRTGHFRGGPQTKGIYKTLEEVARIKGYGDIAVAAHEVAHHVDQTTGLLGSVPSALRPELESLDYNPTRGDAHEGFAEYVRHWLTTGQASTVAPGFDTWFTGWLGANPAMSDAFNSAKATVDQWRDAGAVERVKAQIHMGESKWKRIGRAASPKSAWDWIANNWINRLRPLLNAAKEMTGTTATAELLNDMPGELNFWAAAKVSNMNAAAKARGWARHGTADAAGNKVGPGLRETLGPIANDLQDSDKLHDFYAYAYARHAVTLHDQHNAATAAWHAGGRVGSEPRLKDPGISRVDALATIAEFDSLGWRAAAQGLTSWHNDLIDYLVDAGGLDRASANAMKAMYPNYISLARHMDGGMSSSGNGGRFANLPQGVRRLKGSGRQILPPLESALAYAERIIGLADKIRVSRMLVAAAGRYNALGDVVEKVDPKDVATSTRLSSLAKQLEDAGADLTSADMDALLTVFGQEFTGDARNSILVLYENGKPQLYYVRPDLYRALMALDQPARLPAVIDQTFGRVARAIRLGTTGLRPGFSLLTNPLRDFQTALFQTEHQPRNPFSIAANAASSLVVRGEVSQIWERGGGPMAQPLGVDRKFLQETVQELLARSPKARALNWARHPIDSLRTLFSFPESAFRLAEVEAALYDLGWRPGRRVTFEQYVRAQIAGANVTVDFTEGGSLAMWVNQIVPFFNATIQGPHRMASAIRNHPVATTSAAIMWLTLPTLLLWWRQKDEEWYKDLTPMERYKYWHVRLPGMSVPLRIPKPFEWGHIFSSMPEGAAQSAMDEDPQAVIESAGVMLSDMTPSLMPGLAEPLVEVAANKDFFFDRPLIPLALQGHEAKDQYAPYTTETAKAIGSLLDVSPINVEHLAGGWTGGLATSIVGGLESLAGVTGRKTQRSLLGGPSTYPVVGRMFLSPHHTRQFNDFYNHLEKLSRKHASLKSRGESDPSIIMLKFMQDRSRDLSELRGESRGILADESLSDDDKRERFIQIHLKMVQLAEEANRMRRLDRPQTAPGLKKKWQKIHRETSSRIVRAAATYPPDKKGYKDDPKTLQKAEKTYRDNLEINKQRILAVTDSHNQAQQLLVESFRNTDSKGKKHTEWQANNPKLLDPSYWEKAKALAKLYGEKDPAKAVRNFRKNDME